MLTIADISKSYGTRTLFEEVSLFIKKNDRLGLVGPNGAGKSTLFKIILGEESADDGTITWERGADFGFLPQQSEPAGDETILQIALGHGRVDGDDNVHDVHHEIDYTTEPRAKRILAGLGFREDDHHRPARTFSGGWVMRAHLARLLVREPALLLLDEPTNHLDLSALLWFQDYLSRYPGGLVIISHDRAFLNMLCNGILELRNRTLYRWTGNYDDYLVQKEAHREQQLTVFKNQQREIAHLQRFVDRFGAKASLASRAKSKEKQIERLLDDAVEAPEDDLVKINFRFPQPPRSGLKVVTVEDVTQAYGDHIVYRGLNFHAERGERLVLVGPNGAGKSTLLKILAGVIPIQAGSVDFGSNVKAGYFAQNRADTLDLKNTVLQEAMSMREENPAVTEQTARTLLGGFLFRKDDVFKPVSVLSGGERSRLALVKLLLAPPNLLLMDEPTTHLDMASIDALVAALRQYEGTLIFISHDVYFIRAVARKVLHVDSGRLTSYAGDYDYYLDKSRAGDARGALTAGFTDGRPRETPKDDSPDSGSAESRRSGPKTKEQKRAEALARAAKAAPLKAARARVFELETQIASCEKRQAEIAAELEAPETYNSPGKPQTLNRELATVTDRLQAATAEWEKASVELQRLES
ncbi:putative ABC transporter ATP-binding protein YheS [mine drainage metagenome]|uniref:Putative ABC transporter ATP-binding protein YheS n=1 Tax=mine drainage metagenome TaxID=410659 RepID=A0A1J5S6D2_9ZZZZ